jgi:hypothetical protein
MTLLEIWQKQDPKKQKNLRVRFQDWNHRWRYFIIQEFDAEQKMFKGILDNKESAEYHADSSFWKEYQEGDETAARAI